eukprot:1141149-Pelagomonas_calceolata.AAC.1
MECHVWNGMACFGWRDAGVGLSGWAARPALDGKWHGVEWSGMVCIGWRGAGLSLSGRAAWTALDGRSTKCDAFRHM